MSLLWMGVVSILIFAEKVGVKQRVFSIAVGAALLLLGGSSPLNISGFSDNQLSISGRSMIRGWDLNTKLLVNRTRMVHGQVRLIS